MMSCTRLYVEPAEDLMDKVIKTRLVIIMTILVLSDGQAAETKYIYLYIIIYIYTINCNKCASYSTVFLANESRWRCQLPYDCSCLD